jgi:uncharacterized membrane protein
VHLDVQAALLLGTASAGRLAYTTDIGPHWAPEPFTSWDGFS